MRDWVRLLRDEELVVLSAALGITGADDRSNEIANRLLDDISQEINDRRSKALMSQRSSPLMSQRSSRLSGERSLDKKSFQPLA